MTRTSEFIQRGEPIIDMIPTEADGVWRAVHPNGQRFRVARSSLNGKLNVSLTTGTREFLGYVESLDDAKRLIVGRFGK